MKNIPNLFTLLNLFFGCIAIIFILQNGLVVLEGQDGTPFQFVGTTEPDKIWLGSFFIGLAALVDFLDGLVARLFKATSPLGKQLDSLADVVSFGVAPGMILFELLRISCVKEQSALDVSVLWFLPAFVFPCAAAFRLAKFNIDETQRYGFKGVPTPAAGLLIASLPLISWYTTNPVVAAAIGNKWVLYGLIVLVSWLMTSNLPLMALKFTDVSWRSNWPKVALAVLALLSAVFLRWLAVPVVFVFYIIVSLVGPEGSKSNKKTT